METWKFGLVEVGCKPNSTNTFGRKKKRRKKIAIIDAFNFDTLTNVLKMIYINI